MSKLERYYDERGNASHYSNNRLNEIIKYERIYGTLAVMTFCEISADKYKARIGKKDNQSLEQEITKIKWYEKAAGFYKKKLGSDNEIIIDNRQELDLPWEDKESEKPSDPLTPFKSETLSVVDFVSAPRIRDFND